MTAVIPKHVDMCHKYDLLLSGSWNSTWNWKYLSGAKIPLGGSSRCPTAFSPEALPRPLGGGGEGDGKVGRGEGGLTSKGPRRGSKLSRLGGELGRLLSSRAWCPWGLTWYSERKDYEQECPTALQMKSITTSSRSWRMRYGVSWMGVTRKYMIWWMGSDSVMIYLGAQLIKIF